MATDPQRDAPWVMRTYSGHSTARASNELYRTNLAKGQTGLSIAFDLPTQTGYDPDAPEAAGEVGKVGVPVAHLGHMRGAARRHPGGRHEHLHDDQRHRGLAARALRRPRAGQGRRPRAAGRHDAERHRQGVPEPRHLHLPARPEPAPHRRHHRLHGAPRAEVEPDQRLQLPPPGGGGHAGPGDRLRAGHRHRRARRRARLGQDRRVRAARGGRPHQLLRELERPLRRGDLQDAGLHRAVGPHLPRALRRGGPQAAPLPLRRAGQLARADRAAAGEQRAAHRARDARRDPVQERPGPGHAAARLERGARAAPALGPAVVAAHPAGPRLRVRPARVRRHLRGLDGHRGQDGRAGRGRVGRAGRRGGARRRLRGHRRAEAPARAQPGRAGAPHRVGGAAGGRGQLLHRDRTVTAARRRRVREHPQGRPPRGGRADRGRGALAGRAGQRGVVRTALDELRRVARTTARAATSWRRRSPWPTPAARRGSGPARSARCSASSGRRRASAAGWAGAATTWRRSACAPRRWPSAPAARRASSWPSPGSTGTPTVPSRSPSPHATPASRSSTRASG